ncbi:MAG TPA: tetratricopeptide repeat protein [Steroidobacteraceae bacterium]
MPATTAPTPAPSSRVDVQGQFRKEFDAKNYEAAATLAKTFVELTEKEVGTQGEELQVALMNLATSQYLAGDYVGAESSYLRAIELTEASARPRMERLARANAGLAATYYAGKRYDLAVARFEKAVAFNRRSEGLLSESQLPLLDRFASALTELGRYEEALQVQRYVLRIAERKYGERDPRMAPTLEKIGRWYARVGAYEQSLSALRHAIDIVEDAEGEKSPNLVGPLTAIAACTRQELMDPAMLARASPDVGNNVFYQDPTRPPPFSPTAAAAMGQKALDRAVAIATERPDPSPVQIADVRTQYGDWYETRSQPDKALPQYQQAWEAGSKVPYQGKTLAAALFAKPVLLNYTRPTGWDRYSGRPASEILLKAVTLEATVNADGSTSDAKVIDDSGDLRRADQALKALATAHYRPRFENGQAVATPGVQFSQVFQVLAPKEEAPKEPAPQNTPPADSAPPPAAKDKSS